MLVVALVAETATWAEAAVPQVEAALAAAPREEAALVAAPLEAAPLADPAPLAEVKRYDSSPHIQRHTHRFLAAAHTSLECAENHRSATGGGK